MDELENLRSELLENRKRFCRRVKHRTKGQCLKPQLDCYIRDREVANCGVRFWGFFRTLDDAVDTFLRYVADDCERGD
jgi:hypothetical protein